MAVDMVLMGSLLITGLYHLALFLQRKKNRAPLFFWDILYFNGIKGYISWTSTILKVFSTFAPGACP